MIDRPLDQVSLADIEALVAYGRSEGSTLDFKDAFPAPGHRRVRDFLADVTALANTDGGDRDLHRRAVAAIGGVDMPARIHNRATLVLTVAPLSVLREARDVRVTREHAVLPPEPLGGIRWVVGLEGLIVMIDVDPALGSAGAWAVNHRLGYVDFAWTMGRPYENERNAWPKYVVDHLPGAARSAVARLRSLDIAGPWITMATVVGIRDYRLILGQHHWTEPAWVDVTYLGDVIDDHMGPEALRPLVEGFWRLFGVDEPPDGLG